MMQSHHHATIFVDLDGTLIKHQAPPWDDPMHVLPGVPEKMVRWWNSGALIIITTGRPECIRAKVVAQLEAAGLYYHQLVMGLTSGRRYLINDTKPYDPNTPMALSFNVQRDKGFENTEGIV
jgi:hypothetical protein